MIYQDASRRPIHSNRGFTLLELLVSLTIMGVIVAVAFAGLSIGIDSWRRGTRKIDDLDRRFTAERLLERQIASADSNVFKGDRNQLEFTTGYSLANGPGDPVLVRYQIDPNMNRFVYSETPLIQSASDQAPALTQNWPGFSADGFRYLYTMPNKEREWVPQTQEAPNERPDVKKEGALAVRIDIDGDKLTIPIESTR